MSRFPGSIYVSLRHGPQDTSQIWRYSWVDPNRLHSEKVTNDLHGAAYPHVHEGQLYYTRLGVNEIIGPDGDVLAEGQRCVVRKRGRRKYLIYFREGDPTGTAPSTVYAKRIEPEGGQEWALFAGKAPSLGPGWEILCFIGTEQEAWIWSNRRGDLTRPRVDPASGETIVQKVPLALPGGNVAYFEGVWAGAGQGDFYRVCRDLDGKHLIEGGDGPFLIGESTLGAIQVDWTGGTLPWVVMQEPGRERVLLFEAQGFRGAWWSPT